MQASFKSSFLRDFKKLPRDIKEEVREVCFSVFPKINSLYEFRNYPLRKMKGFKFFYRITVKDFRVGFKKLDGEVKFMRVLPRKDIYKFFP